MRSVGLSSPIQSIEEVVRQCIPALVQGVQMLNSTLVHGSSSSNHLPYQQQYNSSQSGRQRQYRERNPNEDRCYICNEPGHYAHHCPRERNQSKPPQRYSGQRYPQQQYDALYYPPAQHPPPPPIQSRPAREIRAIMAPAEEKHFGEKYEETQSRLLVVQNNDQQHDQFSGAPSITTRACPTSLPRFLKQRPRVHVAKKRDVISTQVIPCPTQEVFVDPFPLELESLFLEEGAISAKFSSKDATTMEPINALVEPTEWSILVEDTRALLEDISGQLSSIGIGSQGSDQGSRAEVFGLVEALVLVKNKGMSDEGDRDISCYRSEECA